MNNAGVYEIRNNVNMKRYIGSSVNIYHRLHGHKHLLNKNAHHNSHLQSAWNMYGAENFALTPILYCDPDMALIYEQICLDGLNPEYNVGTVAEAPSRGVKFSEERCHKMSEAMKGKQFAFGHRLAEEVKRKLSKINMGKKLTEETCKKMSEARKGQPHSEEWKQNIKKGMNTEEVRIKMSEAHKGHKTSEETKQKISLANKRYARSQVIS